MTDKKMIQKIASMLTTDPNVINEGAHLDHKYGFDFENNGETYYVEFIGRHTHEGDEPMTHDYPGSSGNFNWEIEKILKIEPYGNRQAPITQELVDQIEEYVYTSDHFQEIAAGDSPSGPEDYL
jgi:hypothetical protein